MRTDRGRQRFYAAGWVVSAGVMVVASQVWRLHLREVEQRAEEAERTREEVARRRAVEERLRIARELHDSLTHSISVICVQSGVAVHLARKRGEDISPALLAIQEASTDAARELRTTLGALRSEDDDSSGLGHLDRLAARARAAGLPVTVKVTGTERSLPPEVDQAAYRIVQEALTNVSRHAGRASAWVNLCYRPDALEIQVDDDGAGISIASATSNGNGNGTSNNTSNGNGHSASNSLGLIGMRERVTALGGRLQAGPRDGGGFQVRAEIPAEIKAP
ncbi:MAG TPA: histidine kinase [Trebonia sp.]|nr:histidine kinase [Trebonia sp.]